MGGALLCRWQLGPSTTVMQPASTICKVQEWKRALFGSKSRAYILITVFASRWPSFALAFERSKKAPPENNSFHRDRVQQTLTTGVTKLKEKIDNVCVASEIYHTSTRFHCSKWKWDLFSRFLLVGLGNGKIAPPKAKQGAKRDSLIYITLLVFAND